ncbi:MAG: hypothetical protein WCA46_22025 [Actinocatenispora sp.]
MDTGTFSGGLRHYRGGSYADWAEVGRATVPARLFQDPVTVRIDTRQWLPDGFLWGDPALQRFGMGGPEYFFGPLRKTCRTCGADFGISAEEQRYVHETLRRHVDVTSVECRSCRAVHRIRRDYADQLRLLKAAPSPTAHLAVARAGLALLQVGGHVNVDRMIGHSRQAQRDAGRQAAQAARVETQLTELRARREDPTPPG